MTLLEVFAMASAAEQATEKTETSKPEPTHEPEKTPKTIVRFVSPKVVFVLEFSNTVISNGIATNQHGCMGAFADFASAQAYAERESGCSLTFCHSSEDCKSFLATETHQSTDGLEYSEYTIKMCEFKM
jgi:hypothetical protein